jgi:ABC-type dipeptide/oligopeptide/nickel transport system permease component
MIAYFVRLLIKGVITLFLASIMIHTVVSYTPGGGMDQADPRQPGDPVWWQYRTFVATLLELEQPWPFSSLAWLFDPTENERLSAAESYVSPGISINIAGISILGSGILTADFGETFMYRRGTPVMDIIGRGTDEYLLAHLAVLFIALIIACVQRLGRPKLHELPIRLLPYIAAKRSAAQVKTIYNWQAERPLSALLTKL